jgi:hypothetical protein
MTSRRLFYLNKNILAETSGQRRNSADTCGRSQGLLSENKLEVFLDFLMDRFHNFHRDGLCGDGSIVPTNPLIGECFPGEFTHRILFIPGHDMPVHKMISIRKVRIIESVWLKRFLKSFRQPRQKFCPKLFPFLDCQQEWIVGDFRFQVDNGSPEIRLVIPMENDVPRLPFVNKVRAIEEWDRIDFLGHFG